MGIIEILIMFLVVIGIVGGGWLILAFCFMLYGWFETKQLKKKINDNIKKEVEENRLIKNERREEYRRGYESDRRTTEPVKTSESRDKGLPGNAEVGERRNIQIQSSSNPTRTKSNTKVEWPSYD